MCRYFGFLLLACVASTSAFAFSASQFEINCIPSNSLPLDTTCFNEVVGKQFTFWVVAQDAGHGVATNYTGTVHITSSDPTATLPPDYTFTTADNGIAPFAMTFNSVTTSHVPSEETVTATDNRNSLTGFQYFAVFVASPAPPTPATALGALSTAVLAVSLALLGWRAVKARFPVRRSGM